MIERIALPSRLRLTAPLTRRTSAHGNATEISQKLKDGGVSLKEIARTAAQAAESVVILLALRQTHGNRVRAARLLNISYRALLYKIKGFELARPARPGDRTRSAARDARVRTDTPRPPTRRDPPRSFRAQPPDTFSERQSLSDACRSRPPRAW
jgi:hypothetical protein